jgi:hypothetical protein
MGVSIIGAFDVLEHPDDDEAALRQMYKATQLVAASC